MINALSQNDDIRKKLTTALKTAVVSDSKVRNSTINGLQKKKGLVANYTSSDMARLFPNAGFPPTADKILLKRNVTIGSTNVNGRVLNADGEIIYVTSGKYDQDGNDNDVSKLASFLRTKARLERTGFRIDEKHKDYADVAEIAKAREISIADGNIDKLLLDYIYDRKKYDDKYTKSGRSYKGVLNELYQDVSDESRVSFIFSPAIEEINANLLHIKGANGKEDVRLYANKFFDILKKFYPNWYDTINVLTDNAPISIFRMNEKSIMDKYNSLDDKSKVDKNVISIFSGNNEKRNAASSLFGALADIEPEFAFSYQGYGTSKGNLDKSTYIRLKKEYTSLYRRYGITYDTIKAMEIEDDDYYGYKIYKWYNTSRKRTMYFPSRHYLVQTSTTRGFQSLRDTQKYIDNLIQRQNLRQNSLIEFKQRQSMTMTYTNGNTASPVVTRVYDSEFSPVMTSDTSLAIGQIVSSLDIAVSSDVKPENFPQNEKELVTSFYKTLSDFAQVVNSWGITQNTKDYIIQTMNNPEKAAIFIYKVNEQFPADSAGMAVRTNDDAIRSIAENIVSVAENGQYQYYYIENKEQTSSTSIGKRIKYKII